MAKAFFVAKFSMYGLVMFTYETNEFKFSTRFNFCGKERSVHIVNIPIVVIKPEAYFKWDFLAKAFIVAKFSMYGLGAYLKCSNLWKYLY